MEIVNLFYDNNLERIIKIMSNKTIQQNKYLLFTVGAIGTFMATLDGSILNVALPTISSEFSVSIDKIAWVVVSYSLTLISLMLIFGVWVDKKGYFFAYRFGYILFIIGSAMCALSSSYEFLVLSRVIQAIGTAMFAAIGPGMVTTIFGEKERGKGIGLMVMMVAGGFMVGPPLGGFLLNYFNWQALFIINIPIGFVGLFMTFKFFKSIPKPTVKRSLKIQGAASMSAALLSTTFCMSQINSYPLYDIHVWGLALLALIMFALFFYYESKPETALIGIQIFSNRQFTSSIGAMLFMFMALSGISILIPFYLETIKGYAPNQVGLFLTIFPIMMFVFAPLSGRLSDRIGFQQLTIVGLLVLMFGMYILSGLSVDSTRNYIILSFVLLGMGVGIFNTPNSSALMGSVTEKHRAVTSSILGTTRNIGMSIGMAFSTALFTFFQTQNSYLVDEGVIFVKSYETVIYISIGITGIALLFSFMRGQKKAAETI